jgi:hypothetical protein
MYNSGDESRLLTNAFNGIMRKGIRDSVMSNE